MRVKAAVLRPKRSNEFRCGEVACSWPKSACAPPVFLRLHPRPLRRGSHGSVLTSLRRLWAALIPGAARCRTGQAKPAGLQSSQAGQNGPQGAPPGLVLISCAWRISRYSRRQPAMSKQQQSLPQTPPDLAQMYMALSQKASTKAQQRQQSVLFGLGLLSAGKASLPQPNRLHEVGVGKAARPRPP